MSDVVHLLLCVGETLDWTRLMRRTGEHWPLLLAQLLTFTWVYPGYRGNVPAWVFDELLERARSAGADEVEPDLTRGPLLSRFSFTIDIREWGFADPRADLVRQARALPEIRAIAESDVWDERGEDRPEPHEDAVTA